MAFHWDDPEWKAQHLRKIREGVAAKKVRDLSKKAYQDSVRETVVVSAFPLEPATTPESQPETATAVTPQPHVNAEPQAVTFSEVASNDWGAARPPVSPYRSEPQFVGDDHVDAWRDERSYACGCRVRIEAYQVFDMPAYCPIHGEALALKLLRQMWQALRLRTAGVGFMKDRCSACNIPHPRGECRHRCPCHQIAVYLELIDAAPAEEEIPIDGNR